MGVYDIRDDLLVVRIFEREQVAPLVDGKKVKGTVDAGAFGAVTLNGTPDEITRFLGSPEAEAALSKEYTFARRIPPPR